MRTIATRLHPVALIVACGVLAAGMLAVVFFLRNMPGSQLVEDNAAPAELAQPAGVQQGSLPPAKPDVKKIQAQREAMVAAVQRFLDREDVPGARQLLSQWQARGLDAVQVSFLLGLCDWQVGDLDAAEIAFEQTLLKEPQHLAALANLGLVLEQQERPSDALPYYQRRLSLDGSAEAARIDVARALRKLGRSGEAEQVLPTPSTLKVTPQLALEIAEREYAQGHYAEAVKWFQATDLDGAHVAETLRTAASAMAFSGVTDQSQQLFARVDAAQANSQHSSELQRRLQIDPRDVKAQEDLNQLLQITGEPTVTASSSCALYRTKCAACHGLTGAADGRAARFLFPRPRDFRDQRLRLVSTENAIASPEDIARTIRRGIPGTSMPAFQELSESELKLLVESVLEFRRAGLREQFSRSSSNSPADAAATQNREERWIANRLNPGEPLHIPAIEDSPEAVRRGQLAFSQLGCSHCHGQDGSGPGLAGLYDESNQPSVPRNLAQDFMKGGEEPAALFQRIRLGMPGTPHPALASSPGQIVDLVLFCRSVAQAPKRAMTNQQRFQQAVGEF